MRVQISRYLAGSGLKWEFKYPGKFRIYIEVSIGVSSEVSIKISIESSFQISIQASIKGSIYIGI